MNREKFGPLSLHNQEIKHPFRQSLPIEIMQIARREHSLDAAKPAKAKWLGDDVSLFLLSFLTFFTAFYMFIV